MVLIPKSCIELNIEVIDYYIYYNNSLSNYEKPINETVTNMCISLYVQSQGVTYIYKAIGDVSLCNILKEVVSITV